MKVQDEPMGAKIARHREETADHAVRAFWQWRSHRARNRNAGRRTLRHLFILFGIALYACTDVSVNAVDVAQVDVEPASLLLAIGDTGRFTAVLRDAGGTVLSGRPVVWSSSNPSTATVSSDGRIIALAAGDATIVATSEGEQGDAAVTVEPPPVIAVAPASATFRVPAGAAAPSPVTIDIRNDGAGALGGLTASIVYNAGEPTGWLAASLASATAPTTLTLTATPGRLPVGVYTAAVIVSAPDARPAGETLNVVLEILEPEPSIVLGATSIAFTASGSDPAPQTVSITNGGGGLLGGLGATITFTSGQPAGWLTASLNATTAPATLTLATQTGSLPIGSYSATVHVDASVADNAPQVIDVQLDVTASPPAISLAPATVLFSAPAGGLNPAAQSVNITNGGGGTLAGLAVTVSYPVGQSVNWLVASLNGTTAPAAVTVAADIGALAVGVYTATVAVTSSNAANSPQTVAVTLSVTASVAVPVIALSPATIAFIAAAGGTDPPLQSVNVTNSGTGTLDGLAVTVAFDTGQPSGWLTATLSATTAPATLDLQATTGSLAAGTYNATVTVASAAASNSPQSVTVTFTVSAAPMPPAIGISPTNAAFNATEGGADPASQTISVSNTGGGSLTALASAVTYGPGQPTGWLSAQLGGTTAPTTLILQPATGALTAGTYDANAAVTSSAASNSPQTVTVTFTIAAAPVPPAIRLSRVDITFRTTQGGANPGNQTANVTNAGGGTLSGLATAITYGSGQPTGWLTANLSNTTAPATLTLSAQTGSLAAGSYDATLDVSASGASNSPQSISVSFTVDPVQPPIAPTNLNANGQGNMIRLQWTDNSDNEQTFEIQRNLLGPSGPWATIASVPANTTDYRDRNYIPGLTYWYRVLACNAAGCTSSNVDSGSN
ncbi:MAG: beta strand repeat-containing protein [Longimicrobiales bacterium]